MSANIIPLKIFQTWYSKNLPGKMKEIVDKLKRENPEFEHHLFDDNDCREFIKNHFKPDVLYAYDSLIPGAYKADLWRLCVLYIHGGIYLDIKISCINNFKLINLINKEHFVLDRPKHTIYNAFMVCQPKNPFLIYSIYQIVANVKKKYYGSDALSPTGPRLLGNMILRYKFKINIDMKHHMAGGYIIYDNKFILSTNYSEYDKERTETYRKINTIRYPELWRQRRIYKQMGPTHLYIFR